MSPLDAVWHLLNFVAPAVFIALFTSGAARLLFAAQYRGLGWRRLLVFSIVPTLAVAVGGLLVGGRDGSMLTYGAMVGAAAVGVWVCTLSGNRRV